MKCTTLNNIYCLLLRLSAKAICCQMSANAAPVNYSFVYHSPMSFAASTVHVRCPFAVHLLLNICRDQPHFYTFYQADNGRQTIVRASIRGLLYSGQTTRMAISPTHIKSKIGCHTTSMRSTCPRLNVWTSLQSQPLSLSISLLVSVPLSSSLYTPYLPTHCNALHKSTCIIQPLYIIFLKNSYKQFFAVTIELDSQSMHNPPQQRLRVKQLSTWWQEGTTEMRPDITVWVQAVVALKSQMNALAMSKI